MALLRKRLYRTIHHQSYRKKMAFPPPSCVCHTAGKPLPPREKHSAVSRNSTFRHAEKPLSQSRTVRSASQNALSNASVLYMSLIINRLTKPLQNLRICPRIRVRLQITHSRGLHAISFCIIIHTFPHIYSFLPASPLTAICAVAPVPYRSRLSVCRQPEHCPSRSP